MKQFSKFFFVFAIGFAIGACIIAHATKSESEMDYYSYADSLALAEVIDSTDLTLEMLETRNGKLIIERCIGIVDDATNGDGHEINDTNAYICYKSVDGIKKGNVICTYFIYNPDNNYMDDILMRFDYIIDTNKR